MIVAKGSNAILNSLSNVDNGAIGEYICALRLLKMGVQCRIVNMGTSDIIAELDGRIYRIQVKSSQLKPRHETNRSSSGYQFITSKGGKKTRLSEDDCDIVETLKKIERMAYERGHSLDTAIKFYTRSKRS